MATSDSENLEYEVAAMKGDERKMLAEWQALQVAEEISRGLGVKARGEVIADFGVFLGRCRLIFLGFLFREVYFKDGILLT
jgi:hypothetical protein